jgi:soluble lytic murein transglycosylase-like protein
MGALKAIVALAALVAAPAARADAVTRWRPFTLEASARFGLPVGWIERVMRQESGRLTVLDGRPIRSVKGAIGLMQLMPATWTAMRTTYGLGTDPDDPHDNILAGAADLRLMYDRFGHPGMFGAYNAGPARYAAWLAGRQRLPGETMAYLASVTDRSRVTQVDPAGRGGRPLFVVLNGAPPAQASENDLRGPSVLFAISKMR